MKTLENIRNGLFNRAADKFQLQHAELSREKKLFLDWMATELYALYKGLNNSQDYIERNITRRLMPEMTTRPAPAHAIVRALPKKEELVLKPGEDVFAISRFSNAPPYEIYFSPLRPTRLVAARVRWQCCGSSLYETPDGNAMMEKGRTRAGRSFHPGILWLGIEAKDEATLPCQLSFHFDWPGEEERDQLFPLLPLIRWAANDRECPSTIGMENIFQEKGQEKSRYLDAEYLHLHAIEKSVVEAYRGQFVSIKNEDGFLRPGLPAELKDNLIKEAVEELGDKPYLWLKLTFPDGFSPEVIARAQVRLNCFPVLNRKMDKSKDFTPSHPGVVEICALSNGDNRREDLSVSGDFFLGIDRIFSSKTEYRAATFESFTDAPPGYYAVQHGRVEADDFKDVVARAGELAQLLRAHETRLRQVSGHPVQNALLSLETGCRELEAALQRAPLPMKDPGYYLHLKPQDPQDTIYVRFWLTQGKFAEGALSAGDWLGGGRKGALDGDGAWVVSGII